MPVFSWNRILKVLVVPKYSAVIQGAVNAESVSLAADHSSMVKFGSKDDSNFVKVVRYLRRFVRDANQHFSDSLSTEHAVAKSLDEELAVQHPVASDCPEFCLRLNMDANRNQKFVGRESDMSLMDKWFAESSSNGELGVVILHGLGGVGKTQIAMEFSYRSATMFSSVFWIDGSSNQTLTQNMKRAALDVKSHYEVHGLRGGKSTYDFLSQVSPASSGAASRSAPGDSKDEPDLVTPFLRWLSSSHNQRWLLILDNVNDLESFDWTRFLPKTQWGSVIVTSRRSDLALNWRATQIDPMSQEDALRLLEESSQISITESANDHYHAQRLVQKLGYFPLAIAQAGAYISLHKSIKPFETYVELYDKSPAVILDRRGLAGARHYRKDTVLTTWEISFNAISLHMPKAAEILQVCGFLYRAEIQEMALMRGFGIPDNDTTVGDAIGLILSYSLVQLLYSVGGRYVIAVHPLVHTWLGERLPIEERRKMAHDCLAMFYRAFSFSPYDYTTKHTAQHYGDDLDRTFDVGKSHLGEIIANCESYPSPGLVSHVEPPPPSVDSISSSYDSLRYWLEGHYLWSRWAIEQPIRYVLYWLNPDPFRLASWEMVFHIDQRSDFTKNLPRCFKAWIVREIWAHYPRKHPLALMAIGIYADTFLVDDPVSVITAKAWFTWLLAAREQVLGKNHPATMGAAMGLGRVLQLQGNCDDSVRYIEDAYYTRERVLGSTDKLTVRAGEILREVVEACYNTHTGNELNLSAFEEDGTVKARILRRTPLPVLHQAARRYAKTGNFTRALGILASFFYYTVSNNGQREVAELDLVVKGLDIIGAMPEEVLASHGSDIFNFLTHGFHGGYKQDTDIALVVGRICQYIQDADCAASWTKMGAALLATKLAPFSWPPYPYTDPVKRFFQIWLLPPTIGAPDRYADLTNTQSASREQIWDVVTRIVGLAFAMVVELDWPDLREFGGRSPSKYLIERSNMVVQGETISTHIYNPLFWLSPGYTAVLVRCPAMAELWLHPTRQRFRDNEGVIKRLDMLHSLMEEDQSASCLPDLRYTFECPAH